MISMVRGVVRIRTRVHKLQTRQAVWRRTIAQACHTVQIEGVRLLPPHRVHMSAKEFPDHHDAELVLKLYELRREDVMRASRSLIVTKFLPTSFEDVLAVTKSEHPLNAAFRQCSSFWEMTYAMARHGVMHADFMLESNGEGLLLYSRVEPWLAEYREHVSPLGFRNAEWVATETNFGRLIAERFRKRMRIMLAAGRVAP